MRTQKDLKVKKSWQTVLASSLFLVLALVSFLTWGPFLKISKIEVLGNQKVSAEELEPYLKSVYGQNLFRVNLGKLERNLQTFKEIRKVEISRILPNQLQINLEEKKPILLVYSQKLHGLSPEQELLPLDSQKFDLPVITGCHLTRFKYYKKVTHPHITLAWNFYQMLWQKDEVLASQISEISFSDQDNLVIYLMPEGLKVILGMGEWGNKIERLQQVLIKEKENLTAVDLRFKNLAVLKYKKEESKNKLAQI